MTAKTSQAVSIRSVRNNRKSITIEWEEGADSVSRTFHDNPLPSFYKALDKLNDHVVTLCEFAAKDAEKISATGITVRESGENATALIVARKKIKKGKRIFNIATPLLSMYPDKQNPGTDHMEEATAAAIEKVISEAMKYLAGERAQGQIAFKEETPAQEKKGDETKPLPLGDQV